MHTVEEHVRGKIKEEYGDKELYNELDEFQSSVDDYTTLSSCSSASSCASFDNEENQKTKMSDKFPLVDNFGTKIIEDFNNNQHGHPSMFHKYC